VTGVLFSFSCGVSEAASVAVIEWCIGKIRTGDEGTLLTPIRGVTSGQAASPASHSNNLSTRIFFFLRLPLVQYVRTPLFVPTAIGESNRFKAMSLIKSPRGMVLLEGIQPDRRA
jgi:hypothetical protein